jgi:hypothetical protein
MCVRARCHPELDSGSDLVTWRHNVAGQDLRHVVDAGFRRQSGDRWILKRVQDDRLWDQADGLEVRLRDAIRNTDGLKEIVKT